MGTEFGADWWQRFAHAARAKLTALEKIADSDENSISSISLRV